MFQLIQNAQTTALTAEVGKEYDKVTTGLLQTMEAEGEIEFSNLTAELFPCGEAYEAVTTMTAVTCGDQGAINRITGMIYVLSLTILFITFFYFSLFNLAFVQAVQIRRLAGDFDGLGDSDGKSSSSSGGKSYDSGSSGGSDDESSILS